MTSQQDKRVSALEQALEVFSVRLITTIAQDDVMAALTTIKRYNAARHLPAAVQLLYKGAVDISAMLAWMRSWQRYDKGT